MWTFYLIFVILFSCGFAGPNRNDPYIQISKVQCKCTNESFCRIEQCRLKPVRRHVAQLSINVTLYRRPITNCKINIDLYRKYTTYNSFPVNTTLDACIFLQHSNKIPILHRVYQMIVNKSNLNHTCPYPEPYVFVENVTAEYSPFFSFVPSGDYLAKTKWIVDGVVWVLLDLWLELKNPKNTFLS